MFSPVTVTEPNEGSESDGQSAASKIYKVMITLYLLVEVVVCSVSEWVCECVNKRREKVEEEEVEEERETYVDRWVDHHSSQH